MSLSIDKIQNIESVAFMSLWYLCDCQDVFLSQLHLCHTPPTVENDPPTMENDLDPLQWKLRVDPLQGNMVTINRKGES